MLSISFCCIFKNEEKNLPRWIKNIKAIATGPDDEIIAVDTGSTDRSCEILRAEGIEPLYFEWVNDFSAAKNFALSQTSGDWIVFLDCDEYFDEESTKKVRATIEKAAENPKNVIIEADLVNINVDNHDEIISKFIHWRIYKNTLDLKYMYPVHEALHYTGPGTSILFKSDLTILHTGYSSSKAKLKGARNLELLQKEIENNKDGGITTQQAYYMANTYSQLDDVEKTAYYSKIAVQGTDEELGFMTVRMYRNLLADERRKGGDFYKLLDIIDMGLLRAPNHPDLLAEKMSVLLPKTYFYELEQMCHYIINNADNPDTVRKYESNIITNLPAVCNMLSNIKFHKGDVIEARRYNVIALQRKNYDREFLLNFGKVFRGEELAILEPILATIFPDPTPEDKKALKQCLSQFPYNDAYLHYVKPKAHSYEYLMCKGLYTKAVKLCEKELLELFKVAAFCFAKYPKDSIALTLAVPEKYLKGAKKPPKDDITLKELVDKLVSVLSKIILACFYMTEEEFKRQKDIWEYVVSPAKDFILAGFQKDCTAINASDVKRFYGETFPFASDVALSRIANVISVMPNLDEKFMCLCAKDMLVKRAVQGAYDITQKLAQKNYNYYFLMGIIYYYANDLTSARKSFIKARTIDGNSQEVRDFIKWTDPTRDVVVDISKDWVL